MEVKKINIWIIFSYFIIYSFLGYILETIYAVFTKGMLESRQSFVFGPFCAIYGIAGTIMILLLNNYKNNKIALYFGGVVIGIIVEYFSSYIGEKLLYVKWWDYSNSFCNINGRVCLYYSIIWGILSIFLVKYLNLKVENYIEYIIQKITYNKFKIILSIVIFFIVFDTILTGYALNRFIFRISKEYNIDIYNYEINKESINYFDKYFTNEKMIMLFPNISVLNNNNEVIYIGSILNNVKNYYFKF